MLNEPTIEKLHALRLAAMAKAWIEQNKNGQNANLSFDERFGMLVDAEHMARDNRRLDRLLKDAQLRLPTACLEDVEASAARGIDKAMLRQLGSCTWIHEHLNIVLTGKPASARATSVVHSARSLAARATESCTGAFRAYSMSSRSPERRDRTPSSLQGWPRRTFWSSTTGASPRSRTLIGTIFSRWLKIGTPGSRR
jgi:hypothetical protein